MTELCNITKSVWDIHITVIYNKRNTRTVYTDCAGVII